MKMMSVSKLSTFVAMLFLVHFSFSNLCFCIGNRCPEIEKQSLLSFKLSLQDPNNSLSSWKDDSVNCCEWKGVLCNNLSGHVHQLSLQNNHLRGKISPSLLNLKHLKYLDLSQNQFDETIPSFIGSLTSLGYLNLSFADFYGKIPHNIGNLSNLHTLSLESTYYIEDARFKNSLEVDNLEWLLGLSKLEHLNMNGVDLSKASNWPQQVINKLPSLVELHLMECNLNFTVVPPSDVNNNITTSKIAILDLSYGRYDFSNSDIIFPWWIFQLSNLTYLDLSRYLYEGLVPTVGNTTKLKHVDLSFNRFNSSIPDWFYLLKDLEFLYLGFNNLQGAISNSIANLTSLNTLDLSRNKLSGKLPRGISNLCKLQKLDLGYNKLEGEIPDSFGNISDCFLRSLEYLDLSSNSLSGVIPNNLGNLTSLEYLYLQDNKLTGNLPKSTGQLSNLQTLDIENNMLEGVVTETHFSHLSKLESLSASGNHLTLKVSPNWIPPFKLFNLGLGSWNLGSSIPSWLDTQKMNIGYLDLCNTGIYGNVSNWIWSIRSLNLSRNNLHGNIPIISDTALFVYLSSNNFSGQLPRISTSLYDLDLSNNSFSGELSEFLCNTTTTTNYELRNLHLGGNHLTGELPANCLMNWSSLLMLNLSNNNLYGRIPNSIGFLTNLMSLNLHGNNFFGDIPLSMHDCTSLVKIDLSHNNLSGNLPKLFLANLKILILKANKLAGEITSAICQLSSLQILDLSDNMFPGMIPTCVNYLTAMATKRSFDRNMLYNARSSNSFLESASISTKGMELTYDLILPLVTSIDLSKNNLSGHIPKQITTLVELRTLNLSRNRLIGLIPRSIGNMKQLESLDLSINKLSGELPASFTAMFSMAYLNVSYNNLTGRIPESTQLLGFDESSFIGNNLCGPPLSSSCGINDGKSPVTMHSSDEEGDKPEIQWLYVFISLGYAFGLSAFLTILFLKRSWKEAYYKFLENTWDSAYVYIHIKWRRLTIASGRNM